jgi:hypothetical protein
MQAASTCSVCSASAPHILTAEGVACARDTGQAAVSNVPLRWLPMVFLSLCLCSGALPRMVDIGDDWHSCNGTNGAAGSGDGSTILENVCTSKDKVSSSFQSRLREYAAKLFVHKEGSGTAAITPPSHLPRVAGSGNKETIDSQDVCVRRTRWRGGSVLEANTTSAARFDSDLKPQRHDACT